MLRINQLKFGIGMPPKNKLRPRHSHKTQDEKIFRDRYYVWCYDRNYNINLIPISWDNRELAKYVLSNCFGKQVLKYLFIIKGSKAIREGMVFGKNSFFNEATKKMDFVRKYYIPPEWRSDKHTRRHFLLRLYRYKGDDLLKRYYSLTYGSAKTRAVL